MASSNRIRIFHESVHIILEEVQHNVFKIITAIKKPKHRINSGQKISEIKQIQRKIQQNVLAVVYTNDPESTQRKYL